MTAKIILSLLLAVFTFQFSPEPTSDSTPEKGMVEFYISPRNPKYGWYDNGVFQNELAQRSIKKAYSTRSYNTISKPDSLFELYYCKLDSTELTLDSLFGQSISIDSAWTPARILIIFHRKTRIDTVYIDRNYTARVHSSAYTLSSGFKKTLHNLMPVELRENWMQDIRKR